MLQNQMQGRPKDAFNTYRAVGKQLMRRWHKLLRGLEGEDSIVNMAIMLENEWRHGGVLLDEATQFLAEFTGSSLAGPSGAVPQIATYRHYLMPLVRRVYPNLITQQLVGVQPMTGPVAQVFYLKYFYAGMVNAQNPWGTTPTRKGRTTVGTEYANFAGDTWFVDPYYSLQTVFREPLSTGGGTIGAGVVAGAAGTHIATIGTTIPVFNNSTKLYLLLGTAATYAASMVAGQSLCLVEVTGWQNGAVALPLTVTLLAQLNGAAAITNAFTGMIAAGNVFTLNFGAGLYGFILSNVQAAAATTAGQPYNGMNTVTYDYNQENRPEMPELSLEIGQAAVEAQTRRLRTTWSVEASQDMRAMHQIDAEKELISVLSAEIAAEIDRETLNNLIVNAGHRRDYNYSHPGIVGGFAVGGGAGMLGYGGAAGLPGAGGAPWFPIMGSGNFDDRNRALFYQAIEMSNDIYRQSLRGKANWIVTSPQIASKLEALSEFEAIATSDQIYNVGIQQSGVLAGKFKLISDPLFPNDLMLLGYKGPSFMDSGYFYCPYVPLQLTPTLLDTRTFNPTKGIMTRYGKLLVENGERMYGIIKVANLQAVGSSIPAGFPIPVSTTTSGSAMIDGDSDLV